MASESITLGPFRVERRDQTFWQGSQELRVTPKAFAVLRYLLDHTEQVVSKDELLSEVWPDTVVTEAEGYFRHARDIARQQQAKMYELLATTGLAWLALWRSLEEKKAAHQMLSEVYNWFTEGFDTEPLKNAKAVLEELGK